MTQPDIYLLGRGPGEEERLKRQRRASCRAPALEARRFTLVEALGAIVIGLLGLLVKRAQQRRARFCSSPGRTRVRNGRAPRRGYLPDRPLGHWERLSQHRDIHRPGRTSAGPRLLNRNACRPRGR
jgi:hypothetical protein